MTFCFVFGTEPWLLPPALDMIAALIEKGNSVKIVYAEFKGEKTDLKDYDTTLTASFVPKRHGVNRLLTFAALKKEVKKLLSSNQIDILISCDILSLQSINNISGVKKGYWGFEIVNNPEKFNLSFDFYRAKIFPVWINKIDFYLAPSENRINIIKKRLYKNKPYLVVYNCRVLTKDTCFYNKTNFNDKKSYKLIYTGMVSESQYINEIVDAIELLDDTISLTIAGPSKQEYGEELINKIKNNEKLKKKVYFLGRLKREEIYGLIKECDIGFVFYNELSNNESKNPAPNKLSDYIAGGVWILGSNQEYIKYWLEERGAGVCIKEVNKTTIANGIEKIIAEKQFNDNTLLNNIYLNELNMNVQAEMLIHFIKSIK